MYNSLPTLRQLRVFEAVARLKSLNAAAAEIRISQPAAWQAIKKVERAFEATLFERRSTGTYLNELGALLLRRVDRVFALFDAGLSSVLPGTIVDPLHLRVRITMSQVRTLIAAADVGTFSEAAKLLTLSEAALRRGARSLERTIGRTLFDRSAKGIVLNRAGAELSRQFHLAMVEIRHASEDICTAQGTMAGRVVIGSLPLVRTLFLPRAVNALLACYPQASVEIIDGSYTSLVGYLRNGSLDVIIGALRNDGKEDLIEESLFIDPFAIVVRKDHPLTRLQYPTLDDLAACDWVVARTGTPIRHAFELLFAGRRPRANIETSSLTAIRAILVESDRVTILSRRQIAVDEGLGLLTVLRYPLPISSRPIGITTRFSWAPAPLQMEFIRMLREQAQLSINEVMPAPGSPESRAQFHPDVEAHEGFGESAKLIARSTDRNCRTFAAASLFRPGGMPEEEQSGDESFDPRRNGDNSLLPAAGTPVA